MKPILRWAFGVMIATVAGGCGRTPIEDCGPGGPVSFRRPDVAPSCDNDGAMGLLSIETPEDWHTHCGPDEPTVDLSRETLVGYFLEGGCAYSGCMQNVPLITTITKQGCTLVIEARDVAVGELGPCHACLQPRDFVLLDRLDAVGVFELDTP